LLYDISDGGLAVCLAESMIHTDELGLDVLLFREAQSRILFSVDRDDLNALENMMADHPGGIGPRDRCLGRRPAGYAGGASFWQTECNEHARWNPAHSLFIVLMR